MNIIAAIQAAFLAMQAISKIGETIGDAFGDDPAKPLEPLQPLDYEADKKMRDAALSLREAADAIEDGLKE